MSDPVVVSLGEACLRQSDLDILDSPSGWLNDNLLTFAAEYASLVQFKDRDDLAFVHPSTVQMAKFMPPADFKAVTQDLNWSSKKRLFLPINTHSDRNTAGGTHWALLVMDVEDGSFTFYDSNDSSNNPGAAAFEVVGAMVAVTGNTMLKIKGGYAPQQTNSSDCGLYVLAIQEAVAEGRDLDHITPAFIKDYRKRIRNLADDFRK